MPELNATLLEDALAGDPRCVRALVDALLPVVHARVARTLVRRRQAARGRDLRQEVEDMAQDVLAALFAGGGAPLRQWDPARGMGLPGFVGLLAEREVHSILRSRRRSPFTEDPSEEEALDQSADSSKSPERLVLQRQGAEQVLSEVRRRLSDRGLELFQLIVVDERSVEEIGALTGLKRDAIYAWRSRLAKTVREVAGELMSGQATNPRREEGSPP